MEQAGILQKQLVAEVDKSLVLLQDSEKQKAEIANQKQMVENIRQNYQDQINDLK